MNEKRLSAGLRPDPLRVLNPEPYSGGQEKVQHYITLSIHSYGHFAVWGWGRKGIEKGQGWRGRASFVKTVIARGYIFMGKCTNYVWRPSSARTAGGAQAFPQSP